MTTPAASTRFALRLVLAALAVTSAVGCRESDEGVAGEPLGEAASEIVVCPWGPTVPGIDVSYYQQTIDWPTVAASGITFAISRINDGNFMDPQFANNWNGSKAVGLVRGAYQFYEPTMDPVWQANVAVGAVGQLGPGDLPVMLDVEWTDGTPNAPAIQTWIDIVAQGTGKRPMIYTALGYWNQYFNGEFGNIDLVVANWGVACPALPNSWSNWVIWQPGGGPVPGIAGNVDQDVFNGSLQDLLDYANANGSQNCASSLAAACGHFGCGCVDDQCNGVFCPGSGCTAQHTNDCGQFGCNCADAQCSGGFCPGTGCTAKETLDCQSFGCGCVDHACGGGACPGTGCTAKETMDCAAYGQDCALHGCVAPTPPGTGGGGTGGGATETGGGGSDDGFGSIGPGAQPDDATTPAADGEPELPPSGQGDLHGGCATGPGPAGGAGAELAGLVALAAAVRRRRRTAR